MEGIKLNYLEMCSFLLKDIDDGLKDKFFEFNDGAIDVADNPIPMDEFVNKFIEWIESNNWYFGGIIKGMDNI